VAAAEQMNEIIILIWHGMLTVILNNRRQYKPDEAVDVTMDYIKKIVYKYIVFPSIE
jgi:hypothetical protein